MSKLMEMIKSKKSDLSAGRRSPTTKVPENRSRWRLLPSWRKDTSGKFDATEQFWHDFGSHFIKDPATNELKAVYVCVDKTYGRPCEVCESISGMIKASSSDDVIKSLEDMKSSRRILVNAVRVDDGSNKVCLLELPPSAFESILGVMEEWTAEAVLDLQTGQAISIERTGKGVNTKYVVQITPTKHPLDAAVMSQATDIDEYVKQENAEGKNRALSNLSSVAGALPAPGSARVGSAPADLDFDDTLLVPGEPLAAKPARHEDAIDADFKMVGNGAAVEAGDLGDLDDILKDL